MNRHEDPANRPAQVAAASIVVACMAMIAFTFASLILPGSGSMPGRPTIFGVVAYTCFFVAFPSMGGLLAYRRPRNPIGWLFLAIGGCLVFSVFSTEYVSRAVFVGWPLPVAALVAWLGNWTFPVGVGLAMTWVPLLFPDGRLPGPRWRLVGWAASTAMVIVAVSQALPAGPILGFDGRIDNPIAAPPEFTELLGLVSGAAFVALALLGLTCIASLFVRFRRSGTIGRAQLKWFLSANALFLVVLVGAFATQVDALFLIAVLSLASIPMATGIAILRYRLFDIDRIISRTLAYALVTGVLLLTFAVGTLVLQAVLTPITGGSTIAVAGSTLVVFALFQPLRVRVQRAVDRRFDRARYDADQTMAAFALRLRDEVDMDTLRADLRAVIERSLEPSTTVMWVRDREARVP